MITAIYQHQHNYNNMKDDYKKIVDNSEVTKAYISKSGDFLKVETKKGAVLTINRKRDGYEIHSPIVPNLKTGSSIRVSEHDTAITLDEVLEMIEKHVTAYPNFFSKSMREATNFQGIEEAVNQHGNILQFELVA